MRKTFILSSLLLAFAAQADNLVLMHTNDVHSAVYPSEDGLGGAARRKVLVDSIRSANPHTLLIDAGDMVQGSLYFNLYKGEVEEDLANLIGYDMRILGNHEFDNNMGPLAENLAKSTAELLCANYNLRATPLKDTFKPYSIKDYGDKRVAFMPVNLMPKGMISARNTQGLVYRDEVEAANNMAWFLKNIENADLVVALTHIGYGPDTLLVQSSRDIDIVIGGHSHSLVNPTKKGRFKHIIQNADRRDVLVAQTGAYGKHLGVITINLDSITAFPDYRLIPVDARLDALADPAFEAYIAPYREKVEDLNSHIIAQSAVDLPRDGNALLNFLSDFVMLKGKEMAPNVDMSLMNKGGLRNDLTKGPVSEGQIISMLPFFNYIQVIDVSGRNLIEAFNVMAAQGGQGVSDNVNVTYDPTTRECIEIAIDGKPIDPDRTYRLATINYLAEGGDYMQSLADHVLVADNPHVIFDDLIQYLLTLSEPINPPSSPRFIKK